MAGDLCRQRHHDLSDRAQLKHRPDNRGINNQRQDEVDRQSILRHFHPLGQARGHHPPADSALQRTQAEDDPQALLELRRQPPLPDEPQEREQECDADEPAQQAMRPFPPEDRLELIKAHAEVQFAILRDGLVGLKRLGPGLRRQGWQGTRHRLPLDDRQAGFGKARRSADEHHHSDDDRHEP